MRDHEGESQTGRGGTRRAGGRAARRSAALAVLPLLAAGACLNTQSAALEEQPAPLESPAAACRSAAEAEGWTVVEVTDVREVDEGYWEARFVVDDPEMRNLLGCRHGADAGFTEVVRLDE